MRTSNRQRGSALLAVLWMSMALATIAFSLATSIRGETERTKTSVDDLRSYYLAQGGIEHAIVDMGANLPDVYVPGQPRLNYVFPGGSVTVEIIPETAKIDINQVSGERLFALLTALGLDEARAQETAAAILDWRKPLGPNVEGVFDAFYGAQTPSFRARHASIEEIEELLSVRGITPDLFYGTYVRDTSVEPPQFVTRGGLKNSVSVYGSAGPVDVNGASPATMAAVGIPADAIAAVIARRPFLKVKDFNDFLGGSPIPQLRYGGNTIFTLRATARLHLSNDTLSDLRRTVSATVDFRVNMDPAIVVLRWYDRG